MEVYLQTETYLKSSHISRITSILQTILVTLKEELEKKPAKKTLVISDKLGPNMYS